jgi:hypothetical protein
MMKKILALAILIPTLVIPGCYYGPCMNGSGPIVTDVRDISGFTGVRSNGSFEVFVSQAEEFSVEVVAYENLLPIIETYISGYTLVLETKNNSCYKSSPSIKIYVSMPDLGVLELNGSGSVMADIAESQVFECVNNGSGTMSVDVVFSDNFHLANSGSGLVDVKEVHAKEVRFVQSGSGIIDTGEILDSETLSIKHSSSGNVRTILTDGLKLNAILSGSGRIDLSGEAVEADYTLNSSGRIDALNLMTYDAIAASSGSGKIFVWATEFLEVTISGSGDIIYRGDPQISFRITGSGSLRPY